MPYRIIITTMYPTYGQFSFLKPCGCLFSDVSHGSGSNKIFWHETFLFIIYIKKYRAPCYLLRGHSTSGYQAFCISFTHNKLPRAWVVSWSTSPEANYSWSNPTITVSYQKDKYAQPVHLRNLFMAGHEQSDVHPWRMNKKMCYMQGGILLSHKKQIMPFTLTQVEIEIVMVK